MNLDPSLAELRRDADAYTRLCQASDAREAAVEQMATEFLKFVKSGELDICIHGNTRYCHVNRQPARKPEPLWQTMWDAIEADETFQRRAMQILAASPEAASLLSDVAKSYGDANTEYGS